MICVSISKSAQVLPAIEAGAELIELRFDLIRVHPSEVFTEITEGIKTIVTCREGEYSEKERISILSDAIKLGASYVDIELESTDNFATPIMELADLHSCELIFSHHDFSGTPGKDELLTKLEACYERGGVLAKIVTKAESQEDVLRLLSLYEQPGRKVVLGMGDAGRITRVVAPLLGSEFTFASTGKDAETAPGQLSAEQLNAIYLILNGS